MTARNPENGASCGTTRVVLHWHPRARGLFRWVGNALAVLWIFGGMTFFFLRFSFVFYRANQSAIDKLLERLLD